MPTYLPQAELTAMLPTGHGFTSGELDAYIAAGSSDVDAELAHLYWTPFTDYSALLSTAPPWQVRTAAARFAAWHAYTALNIVNALDDDSAPMREYNTARTILQPFRDGLQQLPPETSYTTLYAASWGDDDPYTANEAPLSVTRGEIILESARVTDASVGTTDYQLDSDFYIRYHPPTRKWVFTRVDTAIGTQATALLGDRVYYELTRLRKRESVQPGVAVRLVRG